MRTDPNVREVAADDRARADHWRYALQGLCRVSNPGRAATAF